MILTVYMRNSTYEVRITKESLGCNNLNRRYSVPVFEARAMTSTAGRPS